jgi:DivIVA domain-containing protein
MRRKKGEGATAPAEAGGRITPADVQQVEFRLAFRGYNERDVDAFLDRVTEDLAVYIEEGRRATSGSLGDGGIVPAPGATDAGASVVADARVEAERILANAREEAARIVREAEARAAAAGMPAGDPRASVAPFLSTEREFLQALGTLVQGHAEEVKQMVLDLRARTEQAAAKAAGSPSPADADRVADADRGATVDRAAETDAAEAHTVGNADAQAVTPTTEEEAFAPIAVPEAVGEDKARPEPEPAPAQLRRDSGERSLRELFWGED